MRMFIALTMPDATVKNLEKMQAQLQPFCIKGSFVPRQNLHLTLKFLGETPIDKLFELEELLDTLKKFPAPEMSIQQVSTLRAANIVCAKLKSSSSLYEMETYLSCELDKMGFTVEKRNYTPHITLIRRFGFNMPFSEVSKNVTLYNKPFVANKVVLFNTQFETVGAPTYIENYSVELQNENNI